jgi:ABC-type sulfate transport system permease subunit
MISYLALLVVLAIVFAVITAIEVGQESLDKDNSSKGDDLLNKGIGYGYTVFIALIVYGVNYLFGMIIKYMTDRERHESKTKYLISLVIKMFVAQFLNTAGMYFLLSFRQG